MEIDDSGDGNQDYEDDDDDYDDCGDERETGKISKVLTSIGSNKVQRNKLTAHFTANVWYKEVQDSLCSSI